MRAGLVVTGVLGAGTALVFTLAALTATLFPNGTLVQTTWNGPWIERGWGVGGGAIAVPMPLPAPGFVEGDIDVSGDVVQRDGTMVWPDAGIVNDQGFKALPGDTVGGGTEPEPVAVP